MNHAYGRDLDLNLLRVFVVVADTGSVTVAAAQLYLTQPAISAALRRLGEAIGARLFVRQGRGLALTNRGQRLLAEVRPHLLALIDSALAPPPFEAATSERTFRLGLSDAIEGWLLPLLLRELSTEAPRMRIVVLPVQFRTVGDALASRQVDAAVTVADDLSPSVRRKALFTGGFVCLFDPRHVRIGKVLSEGDYFAHDHVIVSYNGDLRGVVEDVLQKSRRVRCSVPSFSQVGSIVDGSSLLATVPALVADQIRSIHPALRSVPLPFRLGGTPLELLWPAALDEDDAGQFLRAKIARMVKQVGSKSGELAEPRGLSKSRRSGPNDSP